MKASTYDKIGLCFIPLIWIVLYFGWDKYNGAMNGISSILLMLTILMLIIGIWKTHYDLVEEKEKSNEK